MVPRSTGSTLRRRLPGTFFLSFIPPCFQGFSQPEFAAPPSHRLSVSVAVMTAWRSGFRLERRGAPANGRFGELAGTPPAS
ncbi:MAG: hypothetical protein KGN36_15840, partial [Acidobacteriota bacterium]|nr:hypothetical protein [Acidobacteriota bacterium]